MTFQTKLRACAFLLVCLLVMVVAGIAPARSADRGRAPEGEPPAVRELMAVQVGVRPLAELHWPAVLVAAKRQQDAARLRAHLYDLWLLEAAGEPLPPPATVGEVLAAARPARSADDVASQRWNAAFARHFTTSLPAAGVSLPDEIDNLRDQLADAGPGLWLHRDLQGNLRGLFAWVEARNHAKQPFPAVAFNLEAARDRRSLTLTFNCLPPRGTPLRVVRPGETAGYLCRLRSLDPLGADRARPGSWLAEARANGSWRVEPVRPVTDERRDRLVEALAMPLQADLDAWLRKHPVRDPAAQTEAAKAEARAKAEQARPSASRRHEQSLWQRVPTPVYVLTVFAAYAVLANAIGTWAASALFGLAGTVTLFSLGYALLDEGMRARGGGSLLLLMIGVACGVSAMYTAALAAVHDIGRRFVREEAFRRRVGWAIVDLLIMGVLMVVVAVLRQRYGG